MSRDDGITPLMSRIEKINFQGCGFTLIPLNWYQHLSLEKKTTTPKGGGKAGGATYRQTDFHAVTLLAEIVYRYRPVYVKESETSPVLKTCRPFKGDGPGPAAGLWRTNLAYFRRITGFSDAVIREALHRLRDRYGVIQIHYVTYQGRPNTLFIAPIPKEVERITLTRPAWAEALDQAEDGA